MTLMVDGVRRAPMVASPRDILQQWQAPQAVAAVAVAPTVELTEEEPLRRAWFPFSLMAVTLATTGITTFASAGHLANLTSTGAQASSVALPSTLSAPAVAPVAAAPAAVTSDLQPLLDRFVATYGPNFSLYVQNLKTGEVATNAPDQQMISASLYKLFVAQRVLAAVDASQISLGQAAGGGSGNTVNGCLNLMITVSDNTCGRALGALVGWNQQDAALHSLGFTNTTLGTPSSAQLTSARDVATYFQKLYNGSLLSPTSTQLLLGLLKNQKVNDRLPLGLPAGTVFAHKTGDLYGYRHDGGIVYGPKGDFVVVAMGGPWTSPESMKPQFGQLSSQLWNYFEN